MTWFERWCEETDASVFHGNLLWEKEQREMLKRYIGRWMRAIEAHEANENGKKHETS